jgi:tight adherence protein B
MNIVIVIGVFIFTVLLIEGGYVFIRRVTDPELKEVRKRLRTLAAEGYGTEEIVDLLKRRSFSEVPWLNRFLLKIPLMHKIDLFLIQSGSKSPLGVFVLFSCLLVFVGYFISMVYISSVLISGIIAAALGVLPFLYIDLKKMRRMEKFQRQLPEAMDMIARSLKAGHSFSGGLGMIKEEFDDPISTEFSKVLDELNFGVGIPEALKNLALRVDCPDLKFFVVSVIVQRESGGNLAEILENISRLIRERFKLYGHIRTLAAEGKISAYVLIALPFLFISLIYFVNRAYLKMLIDDPLGRQMAVGAILLMIVGIFIMRKMIQIKV